MPKFIELTTAEVLDMLANEGMPEAYATKNSFRLAFTMI